MLTITTMRRSILPALEAPLLAASAASRRSHRVQISYRPASTSTQPTSQSTAAFPAEQGQPIDLEPYRLKAIKLYKELHRLGRDYPDPNYEFNKRLRRAFEKNAKTTDPEALQKQLELGEHIKKEVLALISLKKFRHLRRSYHPNEGPR